MQKLIQIIRENSDFMEPLSTSAQARLEVLQGVKAVLFDVYGTLFISGSGDVGVLKEAQSAEALQLALETCGFTSVADDAGARGRDWLLGAIAQVHAEAKGQGVSFPEVEIREIWRDVLHKLLNASLVEGPVDSDRVDQLAVLYECHANHCWPMPGAKKMLSDIHGRGLLMGLVSNAQFYTPLLFKALLEAAPEELGLDPALCVYSYELREAKPSQRLFSDVLVRLKESHGVEPHQVVYVGNDMLNDIWTATNSGCRTVLFAGDKRSLRLRTDDARCVDIRPDALITSLSGLVDVLGVE